MPGDSIQHISNIRVRVNGRGSLRLQVFSLDDIRTKTLVPMEMAIKTRIEPTRIVNFMEQGISFELKTTERNERFRINRIVLFAKEIFTSYPGN